MPCVNASQVFRSSCGLLLSLSLSRTSPQTCSLCKDRMQLHDLYVETLINLCSATSFSLSSHVPCKQLENGPHAPVYQLLNLFAYGTYCDYKGIFIGSTEHSVNK